MVGTVPAAPRRRRWWRWVGCTAALFSVVIAAAVIAALYSARPLAEYLLSDVLETPVGIGALQLDWPRKTILASVLTLGPPDAKLSAERLSLRGDLGQLWHGAFVVDAVTLSGVTASLELDQNGTLHVAGLPIINREPEGTPARPGSATAITIRSIALSDVALQVQHVLQGKARRVGIHVSEGTLRDLSVGLDGSNLHLDGEAQGEADDVPFSVKTSIAPAAAGAAIDVHVEVPKITLPPKLFDMPADLAALRGTVGVSVLYQHAPATSRVTVTLHADRPRMTGRSGSELAAHAVDLKEVQVDLAGRTVDLGTVAIEAAAATIALTPEGIVVPLEVAASNDATPTAWRLTGGTLDLRDGVLSLLQEPQRLELKVSSARWEGLAHGKAGLVKAKAAIGDSGSVEVSGSATFDPPEVVLAVSGADLPLATILPFVPGVPFVVSRGTAMGTLTIEGPVSAMRVKGRVQVDGVHTVAPAARTDEVMALHRGEAELAFDSQRRHLDLESLRLAYPYVMVQRSEHGVFPYTLFTGAAPADASTGEALTVQLRELQIEAGRADFLDRTVEPTYWTALADIAATAGPITLPGPRVGDFRVTARQDEINPVRATGRADAGGWRLDAELEAVFLPTLNAYLAPLLGYKADSGILALTISGRVAADELRTHNRVTLRNLSFTQTGLDIIQRDTGVPLPIALALLKDPSGTIELVVPVSGDPGSRRFRLGSIIDQALSKAVLGALSSPLKLLGLLFGTKGPPRALAIDPIPFAPGSAALDPGAEARLTQIARILAAHIELTLVAKPEVSPDDVAVVGLPGLPELADARASAVEQALVGGRIEPALPARRLVMVPWRPAPQGELSERSGVYVEMQLSADYGK
jgi:hypothetical protein